MKKEMIVVSAKTIKGTSFVGVRDYRNEQGELSNQTFVVGINYAKLLQSDFQSLLNFNLSTLADKFDSELLNQAYSELVSSLEKRLSSDEIKAELLAKNDDTIVRSKAQTDAYSPVCKGVKAKDGDLYVYGLQVRKTILEKGIYKEVKSRPLTLAKNAIKKAAELRENKFRQFKVGRIGEVALMGATIS